MFIFKQPNVSRELLLGNHKPTWGLIVLLVSKAAGIKAEFADVDRDVTAGLKFPQFKEIPSEFNAKISGILHSQRVLAEITEMMKTSNIIHKSLQNVDKINTKDADDVNFGNKLALLTGDYLLSTCFRELAVLRNQAVNELVSTALRDLSEAEFLGPRDLYNRQLPAPPKLHRSEIVFPNQYDSEPYKVENVLGNAKAEWTLRNLLGGATLLAKCCQGALQLGGHSVELQKEAYKIGRNMALAWQLKVEKESITAVDQYTAFNLTCAPMLFHLEDEPRFYIDLEKLPEDVDYFGLRERLRSGSGLKKTHALQLEFSLLAQEAIDKLPDSKSKGALSNVLNAT